MRWEELSAPAIEALDRDRTVVILPLGSVEQHGRHMAVGTDTLLAYNLALAAADRLADASPCCRRLVRLFGASHALCRHRHASPRDAAGACRRHRCQRRRAWIPTASDRQRPWRKQWRGRRAGLDAWPKTLRKGADRRPHLLSSSPATRSRDMRESAPGGMGHACEFETSMLLHLRPDLVAMERAAVTYPDPGSNYLTTDLVGGSAVRTYHDFGDLSESGTLGDPSLATRRERRRAFTTPCLVNLSASSRTFRPGRFRAGAA